MGGVLGRIPTSQPYTHTHIHITHTPGLFWALAFCKLGWQIEADGAVCVCVCVCIYYYDDYFFFGLLIERGGRPRCKLLLFRGPPPPIKGLKRCGATLSLEQSPPLALLPRCWPACWSSCWPGESAAAALHRRRHRHTRLRSSFRATQN